jgi:hypothetical protein
MRSTALRSPASSRHYESGLMIPRNREGSSRHATSHIGGDVGGGLAVHDHREPSISTKLRSSTLTTDLREDLCAVVGGENSFTNSGRAVTTWPFREDDQMEHTNDRERNVHLDSENGPQ